MPEVATYTCFISHAPDDDAWVHGFLLPALGLAPEQVITSEDFVAGASIVTEFERAITSSEYTLFVLSPAYVTDAWTAWSEQLGAYESIAERRDCIVPILLHPTPLPLRFDGHVVVDCTDEARWPEAMQQLRTRLAQPLSSVAPLPCPYPGMVPFGAKDAAHFYGRAAETKQMLRHLRNQRLLWVIGPSGSGKSSLVFAGLLPQLAQSSLFPAGWWRVRQMRPGATPMTTLVQLLGAGEPGQALGAILAEAPPAQRLLLVVDQWEEVFTQAERSEQARFVAALLALAADERCALVMTMRADFYPNLMTSPLWPIDASQRLEIAPLHGAALQQAIAQPAADVGVYLESALLERLVADAADEPGALPLIQETMRLLWADLPERLLTLSAYEQLGHDGCSGLAVAVTTKADATIAALTPAQQRIARRIFLCLVQFGDGCPDTRRQQPLAELCGASDASGDFDTTVEQLTRNRLLTRSGDDQVRGPLVDLSHEALLTGWPRLRTWLAEDRADLLLHRRLSASADDWCGAKHDSSFLYGGARLLEAQRYAREHADELSQDETEFLAASAKREAIRERGRYLGQAAGGAVGAALGYGLAFTLGFWATRRGTGGAVLMLNFLAMFVVGQAAGFAIGVALWLSRAMPAQRLAVTTLVGALSSGLAYALFKQLVLGDPFSLGNFVAGAILGAGLGLGVGMTQRRMLSTLGGGVAGALLVIALASLPWQPWVTLLAGVLIGSLTGLGFQLTAVDRNEKLTA